MSQENYLKTGWHGTYSKHTYHKEKIKSLSYFITSLNLQAPCVLYIGQVFRYSPENAFYIFNQRLYFVIWYSLALYFILFFWDLLNNLNLTLIPKTWRI